MGNRDSIFISYARDDDSNSNGWITLFEQALQKEIDIQTGDHVHIFFDKQVINIGDDWSQEIQKAIRERTSHFIAFISMAYLKRPVCRRELEEMLQVEETLGKEGMILPIYFIGSTRRMEDIDDPLIKRVVTRTYYDWREFRFTPPDKGEILQMVSKIVQVILALDERNGFVPAGDWAAADESKPVDEQEHQAEALLTSLPGAIDISELQSAGNDDVYMKSESDYDDCYLAAAENALGNCTKPIIAVDLDCRGAAQAQHHAALLGNRLAHLFVRVKSSDDIQQYDRNTDNITYFALDNAPDFAEKLHELWLDNGYPQPDYLFSDSFYRRFRDMEQTLVHLRREYLSPDGGIVFKCFDDGTKVCFPESKLMNDIISETSRLPIVSDRFNGRKIYTAFMLSGYKSVMSTYKIKDTIGMDVDERLDLFDESFAYRLDYFKKDWGSQDGARQEAYQRMKGNLRELRLLFCRDDFYYAETNMFFSARCR